MPAISSLLTASLFIVSLLSVAAVKTGTAVQSSQQTDSKLRVSPVADTPLEGISISGGSGSSGDADAVAAAGSVSADSSSQLTNSFVYPKLALKASYHGPFYSHAYPSGAQLPPVLSPHSAPHADVKSHAPAYSSSQEENNERGDRPAETAPPTETWPSTRNGGPRAHRQESAGGEALDCPHRVKRRGYNAPYFVGKRSLEESEEQVEQDELKKRSTGSEVEAEAEEASVNDIEDSDFHPESLDLQSRASPMFVGRRSSPMFVGKRRAPYFVGKRERFLLESRSPSPMFVGRSAPMFIGKKAEENSEEDSFDKRGSPMFVGKRPNPMFVGKRPNPMFVGKRPNPMFVGKRPNPMFVGKRPNPMFVGKRPNPMFVGKRPNPMFVGKRRSPMFVGKRSDDNERISELLTALHTLQEARRYRRIIQTDKRLNAPYFVGKKSDPDVSDLSAWPEGQAGSQNENFR